MRQAVLFRVFAAIASVVVTIGIFDQVARMGRSADSSTLASTTAPAHGAVIGRQLALSTGKELS